MARTKPKKKPKPRRKTEARSRAKGKLVQAKTGPVPAGRGPQPAEVIPGEIILGEGDIVALEGRPTFQVTVSNVGDRPIQVGSHCHFFEANRALRFDREKAYGSRLLVPAGTAVRFEPGEEKRVTLVAIGGHRVVYGINGLVNGRLDDPAVKGAALRRAAERGFL